MGKVKIGNFKGPQGETGPQGPAGPQGPEGPQGPMGEVDANTQIVFTQAASRENIASGEKLNIILGKIRKWFADIKAAAFQDVSNALTTTAAGYVLDARQGKILDGKIAGKLAKTDVVNGLTETAAGKALDARQGKALNEKIDDTNEAVSELNSKLTWKLHGQSEGSGKIALPETYNELIIYTISEARHAWSANIPHDAPNGYVRSGCNTEKIVWNHSESDVYVATCTVDESDYISKTTTYLYYR